MVGSTAKSVSRALKLPFDRERLLREAGYDARLGVRYLGDLVDRFGGSYVLALAAYNAGPGAVMQWSPKGPLDAVVEQIPVDETRNYVKKVTGSWATYAILDGSIDEVAFPLVL